MQKLKYRLKQISIILILGFFTSSIGSVFLFKFINPPITPLMLIRNTEYKKEGKKLPIQKSWVNINKISPHVINAVISAEDKNFWNHNGFDWEAIKEAHEDIKTGKRLRGGSTISQQTAKNVFLTPKRSYIRKGLEVYFTFLIETVWSKERILEVYLNVIELGKGVYGIETASKKYYKKEALSLSKYQAALITSAIPAPRKRNLAKPSAYMYKYQQRILSIMAKRKELGLEYKPN